MISTPSRHTPPPSPTGGEHGPTGAPAAGRRVSPAARRARRACLHRDILARAQAPATRRRRKAPPLAALARTRVALAAAALLSLALGAGLPVGVPALARAQAAASGTRPQPPATQGPPPGAAGPPAAAPAGEQPATAAEPAGSATAGQALTGQALTGQALTVWTTYQGAALAWLEDQAAAYGQAFGKKVGVSAMKLGDIKQRAMQDADKGHAGDLFVGVPHDQFSALADAGVLADMSDFATARYLGGLSAEAARAFRYRGTLYGLPLTEQGPALIVNTRLLKTVPGSYQQLERVAASLTRDGRYGFAVDAENFYYAYGWLRSFGGYVFGTGPDGRLQPDDVGIDSAGAVAGLRALKALRYQEAVLPQDSGYGALRKLFLAGKLAMIYDGPWAIPAIVGAGIPVSVAPMPPLADGTPWHGFMNVEGVLMNHYSGDPVGAANLAKWLTQPRAQAALAKRAGAIPVSNQALADVRDDAIVHGFGEALQAAEAIPNVPAMGSVWGPMDDALSAIMGSPDSEVGAILARAAAKVGGG